MQDQFDGQNQFDELPCKLRVGFLFKRVCGRISREGCEYCHGKALPARTDTWQNQYDPYFEDRNLYPGYGSYSQSISYYDFTDADASAVMAEREDDFERQLDAS